MSDDEYGDDFEDYNEDFEDFDDAPVAPTPRNQPAYGTISASFSSPSVSTPSKSATPPVSIVTTVDSAAVSKFSAAPLIKPSSAIKKPASSTSFSNRSPAERARLIARQERLQLIRRDVRLKVEQFDAILDLAPISQFDRFQRQLGRHNATIANVGTQFNDDWLSKDSQARESFDVPTEGVLQQSKSCQFPDSSSSSSASGTITLSTEAASRLPRFVHAAGQVMETLLLENAASDSGFGDSGGPNRTRSDALARSIFQSVPAGSALPVASQHQSAFAASMRLAWSSSSTDSFLKGRRVAALVFSPAHPTILLSAHSSSSTCDFLPNKGLICLWDINQPTSPQKVMSCDGDPISLCFSPDRGHIVLAGLREGSIALWDLREPSSLHSLHHLSGDISVVIRRPSFTTDNRMIENHNFAVRCIHPLKSSSSFQDAGNDESSNSHKTSFQVASLDAGGVVLIWTVVELAHGDLAGSDIDLGLGVGARVKLMRSAVLPAPLPTSSMKSALLNDQNSKDASKSSKKVLSSALAAAAPALLNRTRSNSLSSSSSAKNLPTVNDLNGTLGGAADQDSTINRKSRMVSSASRSRLKSLSRSPSSRSIGGASSLLASLSLNVQGNDLVFNPQDANEFFLALGLGGGIVRSNRFAAVAASADSSNSESSASSGLLGESGGMQRPTRYAPAGFIMALTSNVFDDDSTSTALLRDLDFQSAQESACTLDFSPFSNVHFLAGYESGLICLYHLTTAEPTLRWHCGASPITRVQWSTFRPSLFFALDAAHTFYVFDLLTADQRPLATLKLADSQDEIAALTFSVSSNVGHLRIPSVALSTVSGSIDVHLLQSSLCEFNEADGQLLKLVLEQ